MLLVSFQEAPLTCDGTCGLLQCRPKCIFSWRLAADKPPTRHNKWRRNLKIDNTCTICGAEASFQAAVFCTQARVLRDSMREFRQLPCEDRFVKTGPDLLLVLLDSTPKEQDALILLTLGRSWHLRNNVIHAKGGVTIQQSVQFLLRYLELLNSDSDVTESICLDESKGKKGMCVDMHGILDARLQQASNYSMGTSC